MKNKMSNIIKELEWVVQSMISDDLQDTPGYKQLTEIIERYSVQNDNMQAITDGRQFNDGIRNETA